MTTLRAAIWLAVLALASAVPAQAQVTTLDQQLSIWDGLIRAAQSSPASVSDLTSFLPAYGFWCGPQSPPAGTTPFDCVDAACMAHDLSPAYSTSRPTLAQVAQADTQFIGSLAFTQAATPYGELYRNAAIQVFEAKWTFEQANRTTLFTRCLDCQ